jgi:hypothetical protein
MVGRLIPAAAGRPWFREQSFSVLPGESALSAKEWAKVSATADRLWFLESASVLGQG